MHLQLDSRPGNADVSADGLTLRFAPTAGLDVVGTMSASLAGARVSVVVEVLAASHRVHVFDGDGLVATEQVACVSDAPHDPLPTGTSHQAVDLRLDFTSERPELDAVDLAALAEGLRAASTEVDTLVVSFPGHRDALTSVRLLDEGWETWHLYPGDRPHAVRTRTTVTAR